MSMSLHCCAEYLRAEGVRHHVDTDERAIRVVFVTQKYKNLRSEKLAILSITVPDDGRRCRVALERAFAVSDDPAADCMSLAQLAADTPLVGFEFDADFDNLRMVSEVAVEDGGLTSLQLLTMVDRLVEAAEVWQAAVGGIHAGRGDLHPAALQGDVRRSRSRRAA